MGQQTYVFDAELLGFPDLRRAIAVREDLTLVDLHYALQSALGWDDDHLFAFWLRDGFWAADEDHYVHPLHARGTDPLVRSACTPLDELDLSAGRRISYVFDFEREWRVVLTVRERVADEGGASPRLLESVGAAPPQYAPVGTAT